MVEYHSEGSTNSARKFYLEYSVADIDNAEKGEHLYSQSQMEQQNCQQEIMESEYPFSGANNL